MKSMLVVDNCLREPELLNKEISTISFHAGGKGNPSSFISDQSKYTSVLKSRFLKLSGKKNHKWSNHQFSGTYRKSNYASVKKSGKEVLIHSDMVEGSFICMLYLSPQEDCHGGTGLYRHKETGLYGFHDLDAVAEVLTERKMTFDELIQIVGRDAKNPKKWDQTDLIGMKYNRLFVYNGKIFHSHVFDFKKVKKTADRLTYFVW